MPILKDVRQSKLIKLNSIEGAEIEIFDSILAGQALSMENETTLQKLCKFIKKWNFTDEKGDELAINENSLGLLNTEAFTELTNAINDFSVLKKKD